MAKVNYHIHSTGSDGNFSPRQVIEKSIKAGIKYICFTDHYNYPKKLKDFNVAKTSHKIEYSNEILNLKEEFKESIDISFGMEFDFLDKFEDYTKKEISKREYDFVMGSVHVVLDGDNFLSVPWEPSHIGEWKNFIKIFGSEENAIRSYYEQVRKLVKSGLFDCVGHFDLIKNYYPGDWKTIEEQRWYKKIVLDILDQIKKKGLCIEINTSGWNRLVKEQYPSEWIIKEMRKKDIPITIGNDFHGKHQNPIDEYLNEGIKIAKKMGYKNVLIFHKRKPIEVEI